MASRKDNPRFPHRCRIYRIEEGDELHDGEEVTIYEGECAIYEANNLRQYTATFGGALASKEDMGCDIPGLHPEVHIGDRIDYERYEEKAYNMLITTPIPSTMGSTFRFNRPKI